MKVDFLLIGAAKSATTSLCNAISQHPQICFSNPKEPEFFCKVNWRSHLDQYHGLFEKEAKLYGEGSTNYSKWPLFNKEIHRDIKEYNPNMKIIYIMRDPIDRIVSQYIHYYNRGHEIIKDCDEAILNNPTYIDSGKYAMQITPYIKHFGKKNVLLLFFDDFIKQPQTVMDEVFKFLNIKTIQINYKILDSNKSFSPRIMHHKYDNPRTVLEKAWKVLLILKSQLIYSNQIKKPPKLLENTKDYVIKSLTKDIHEIEKLTNRDLSQWLRKH